jgi:acyl carrier protein
MRRPVGFDEFRRHLASALDVDPELLQPTTAFGDNLGFDSLRMLELASTFESLTGEVPETMAWDIKTVRDAYVWYIGRTEAAHGTRKEMVDP